VELLATVVEILSETLLLLKADEELRIDDILVVFGEIRSDSLAEKHNLPVLYAPKGEVRIVAQQSKDLYLAETFRELVESKKVVEKQPSSLLSGIWASEILREKVLGPPSAVLGAPTAPTKVSKEVMAGDRVGNN